MMSQGPTPEYAKYHQVSLSKIDYFLFKYIV